jgi:hypothetical protein
MLQGYCGRSRAFRCSAWARFAASTKQSGGEAGCGSCHYPPNADSDYDYGNKRIVKSSADDWQNYPHLKGTKTDVTCENWDGPCRPDGERSHLKNG